MAREIVWERASINQKFLHYWRNLHYWRGYDPGAMTRRRKWWHNVMTWDSKPRIIGRREVMCSGTDNLRPIKISKGAAVWRVLVSTRGSNVFRRELDLIFQILLYIQVAIYNCLPLILKIVKLKLNPSSQVSTCSLQVTMFSWIYLCTDFHWFWFSPFVLVLSATSQVQAKFLCAWLYIITLAVGFNSSLPHILFHLMHFILKQISV